MEEDITLCKDWGLKSINFPGVASGRQFVFVRVHEANGKNTPQHTLISHALKYLI